MSKFTVSKLAALKAKGEKFGTITAYDATFAKLFDECGVPALLIGDSLGMVVQGHSSTVPVTIEEMVYHTKCVARGATTTSLIIADMPFCTYATPEQALRNAARLMQAGAGCVKFEGGERLCDTVRLLTENGIPVCAHLGLTPQSFNVFGGYKIQGRTEDNAKYITDSTLALEEAGAGMEVLECVPAKLAADISKKTRMPIIGIGAGSGTDGQILVMHDAFGFFGRPPKFARNFLKECGTGDVRDAVKLYLDEVKNGSFPSQAESFE